MSKQSDIELEKQLRAALNLAGQVLDLEKYEIIIPSLVSLVGYGFSSEFFKPFLRDNVTGQDIRLAVKKAPNADTTRQINAIKYSYENEIHFYTHIYPAFQAFGKKHNFNHLFDFVPPFICCASEPGKEIIVFKDITFDGFQLRDKNLLFDDDHTKMIFKTYGEFHAISFCLKKQEPAKFQALVHPLTTVWKEMIKCEQYKSHIEKVLEESYEALDKVQDKEIREKFIEYVSMSATKFEEALSYNGEYSALLHGDCWSNNTMFKYEDPDNQTGLKKLKLLDFQMILMGSPVFDLSYFFYSGCEATLFDSLELYLDVYYESFRRTASNLKEDSNSLYPREALSDDFKQYAKLGVILALVLVKYKMIPNEAAAKLRENMDSGKLTENDLKMSVDENEFKERVRNILRHVYKNGAL